MNISIDPAREHLPDLTTVDGVVDFFALCILGIFCNILDTRTYQCGPDSTPPKFLEKFHIEDDTNNISVEERHKCIRTRGLAYDLVFWFFETHEVTDNDAHRPLDRATWFVPHLVQVTTAMVLYVESYQDSHSNIIEDEFRYQVTLCFEGEHDIQVELEKAWQEASHSTDSDPDSDPDSDSQFNTLAYVGPRNLTIARRRKGLYQGMLNICSLAIWHCTYGLQLQLPITYSIPDLLAEIFCFSEFLKILRKSQPPSRTTVDAKQIRPRQRQKTRKVNSKVNHQTTMSSDAKRRQTRGMASRKVNRLT